MQPNSTDFVSVEFFQWSMGLLITAVVGVYLVFAKRLFQTPTRDEVTRDLTELSLAKQREHDAILKQIEAIQRDNKEALIAIREAVTRLEAGYFMRFRKQSGDPD